jgi:hypothetical protein
MAVSDEVEVMEATDNIHVTTSWVEGKGIVDMSLQIATRCSRRD